MMERNLDIIKRQIKCHREYAAVMALLLAAVVMLAMLTGCTEIGAEAEVRSDLEEMREIELDDELSDQIDGILNDRAKEYFEVFMDKVSDFDYEITGSEQADDGSTVVNVRITTYSFGREYLSTWSEYIEAQGDGEFDQAAFYEMLMKNLSSLELKSYDMNVDITCEKDDDSDGDWETDVESNMALRDAVLGGLITEIASVADF